MLFRAVVTGVAGVAFATPAFWHFQGKSCEMLHLKYDFPLVLSLCYPGFKNLSTALPHYSIVTPMVQSSKLPGVKLTRADYVTSELLGALT